ncbi:copper/silver efflux system outer membrane protein CusC [Klebsiella pneumoniae]|uniref:efflux transporter outer membrane subunit n=2 Tax=Klebsiella pneumoniae TaxID=573 RepID=UPI000E1FB610|nr:efflux transporter outer membrane subunit [Klebsiella pneumoniae]EKW1254560.1 efflux transporter outer membrane subunit [Klebsiella pneumoniae]MBX9237564.1 efflux transporter outer membrane subunit [Klebsiella pneumoniae]MDX8140443.1 efflux transporter outer membrane subunit [Klebsiella pneumoniae]SVO48584.1 copper/silver efflux system outer membrane protein CusC [Klebsiella pneumoniae]VGD86497.1 copper/silver efflux system outer membrane protein CusC [Klebsiella pneumoniae]
MVFPVSIKLHVSSITVMTTLLLSGCSMAPAYQRPEASVPLSWSYTDTSAVGTGKPVSAGPFFKDSKLQQLIKLTIDNNKDLELSALNLKKSGVQYGVERLAWLPAVSLTAQKTAAHEPAGIFDTIDTGSVTYHQYDVKLVSASWEVDFWGRLQSLREASLNEYLARGASSRALKISLIEQVVSAYLIYIADQENISIARQKLDNVLQLRRMQRQAFAAGDMTKDAVMDADSAVSAAQTELNQTELQAQQDLNSLQLLVGTPLPGSLLNVSPDHDWAFPSVKAGIPSDVLLKRPDIIAAEYQLKAANASIGAARAAFFPSISITAEGGSSTADMGKLLSAGTANWSFVPTINLPIFDGGKNQANLSLAELNKKVEIVNYQKAIQQAFRDTSDALAGQASLRKQTIQISGNYETVREQYRMAEATRNAGQISNAALLQKNNELLAARKQDIDARLKYLIQGVKVFTVLGGDESI